MQSFGFEEWEISLDQLEPSARGRHGVRETGQNFSVHASTVTDLGPKGGSGKTAGETFCPEDSRSESASATKTVILAEFAASNMFEGPSLVVANTRYVPQIS
jgi:hypothetical protein